MRHSIYDYRAAMYQPRARFTGVDLILCAVTVTLWLVMAAEITFAALN